MKQSSAILFSALLLMTTLVAQVTMQQLKDGEMTLAQKGMVCYLQHQALVNELVNELGSDVLKCRYDKASLDQLAPIINLVRDLGVIMKQCSTVSPYDCFVQVLPQIPTRIDSAVQLFRYMTTNFWKLKISVCAKGAVSKFTLAVKKLCEPSQ